MSLEQKTLQQRWLHPLETPRPSGAEKRISSLRPAPAR